MFERQRRIHIVGVSPRTGTTLLHELMIGGFEVDGYDRHELGICHRPDRPYDTVVTKAPRDLVQIRKILPFWSNLWVLGVLRDPRDVIVSRHGRYPDRYYVGLRIFLRREPALRRLLGHPRFQLVRYEDLAVDPDGVQSAIKARIPFLVRRHPFSEYAGWAKPSEASLLALKGLRPITTASVGVWRQHKPRLVSQLRRFGDITPSLRRWGYETDESWLEALAGVESDDSPSYLPDGGRPFWQLPGRRVDRTMGLVRCIVGLEPRVSLASEESDDE